MVAAAVKAPLQNVAAQAFATNELMFGLPLHRPFADATALAVVSRMTAPGAERLPGIFDWRLKLGAALGITAVMPDFDSELGHSYTSDPRN